MKYIFFYLMITLSLYATVMDYMKRGSNIIDIGKRTGNNEIVVPKSIIEYEPILKSIENAIYYEERILEKETCIIDGLGHEYCPIDKIECTDDYDYLDGNSIKEHALKISDPFCIGDDMEMLNSNDDGVTFLECFLDDDLNHIADKATSSLPPIDEFEAIDTVDGEGDWDTSIIEDAVVQRKNPGSPTFFVYSPTTTERDNMIIEGDLSMDTSLATENPGDDDWIGFVFGFQDKNNYYYLSWRRDPATSSSPFTGFTLGKVTDGTIPFGYGDTDSHEKLQQETNIYGWENNENYKVKIVYNSFFIKAYIAKYLEDGSLSAYQEVINYNPDTAIAIQGKMGFMNHSNGGAIYKNFKADYCPIGYAVDGNSYTCKREPDCQSYYTKIRIGDVGVIHCEMEYDFYNYTCPDEVNVYGNNYFPQNPGGDCGHITCTNDATPPKDNCIRLKHGCPVSPDNPCVAEEKELDYNDFTKWTVENYKDLATSSDWEVLNKNSVIQHINGRPTYFLSNYELKDGHITMEGKFRTDDPWDNDWFGFVFGFKDKGNYFLLDWSRWENDIWRSGAKDEEGNPIDGGIPLTLTKLTDNADNIDGNLWKHNDNPPSFDVLARRDNGGWSTGQTYEIKLDITNHDIKVWIGKEGEELHLDIDYHSDALLDITGKLGFYNYSISEVTYRDFTIEWVDGKDIEHIEKRTLAQPTVIGEFKSSEEGVVRGFECGDSCKFSLTKISADGNKLCLEDRVGTQGCFTFSDECNFNGQINENTVTSTPLLHLLNYPGEPIEDFHLNILEDHSSPTGIAIDFSNDPESNYPLKQVKTIAQEGDQITVDFWMYWRGVNTLYTTQHSMPMGFELYDLYFHPAGSFGFNTGKGDAYGIQDTNFLKNSWHKITAIFTHGNLFANKLYIDGALQTLEDTPGYEVHDNSRADITKSIQLSGWTANTKYSMNGKIAGFNVYDGALSSEQIKRLYDKETFNGITYLNIEENKISGYDANNTFLGSISSTCPLSGKVGDFAETKEVPFEKEIVSEFMAYDISDGDDYIAIPNNEQINMIGREALSIYMHVRLNGVPQSTFEIIYNKEGQYELSVDENGIVKFALSTEDENNGYWEWISTGLKLPIGEFKDLFFSYNGEKVLLRVGEDIFEKSYTGKITIRSSDEIDADLMIGDRYHPQGEYTPSISISDFKIWERGLSNDEITKVFHGDDDIYEGIIAHYNFTLETPTKDIQNNLEDIVIHGDISRSVYKTETETVTDFIEKLVSYPIVSAKAEENRILFWDSFTRGAIGFIEPIKYVKEKDALDGYEHEFKDFDNLYHNGFTSFVTSENNITYAISTNPMDVSTCLDLLSDTKYFLSDRNLSDEVEMSTLNALTPYLHGEFRDFCVIEKNGAFDNRYAEYGIKETVKSKVYETFVCSPWSCLQHECGTASCKQDFSGNIIMPKDRDLVLNSTMCISQECDINFDYFSVCGNKNGCPDLPYVYQQEDGSCLEATCEDGEVFNSETGKCEKMGCKNSIERDGRCYKSL